MEGNFMTSHPIEAQPGKSIPKSKHWDAKIEQQLEDNEEFKRTAKIVSRSRDMVWGDTKYAHNTLAVSPMLGFAIKTMHAHIGQIAPGGNCGLHRHASEAIMMCLAGKGYTIVDGVRHDWEAGDCIVMPAM